MGVSSQGRFLETGLIAEKNRRKADFFAKPGKPNFSCIQKIRFFRKTGFF